MRENAPGKEGYYIGGEIFRGIFVDILIPLSLVQITYFKKRSIHRYAISRTSSTVS